MAGGLVNLSSNIQISDNVYSSSNVETKNESTSTTFKDAMKNQTEKNSSKVDETTEKVSGTKKEDDITENVDIDKLNQEQILNEFVSLAQNQIIYSNFVMDKNVETPVVEQVVSQEGNIVNANQESIAFNTTTNLSNIKVLDNVNTIVDENVHVDKNISNEGNIVLNTKDTISTDATKDFKVENLSVLQNGNTSEKISNSNTQNNISENRNVLNYTDDGTEKNIVLEKSSDSDLFQKNNEVLVSGFETALQTVQKTPQGDIIQFKVSDSNLINADTVVNDLADKIIMRNNNEFDLQLNPKELGEIHINVVFENGETKVSILCTTQQAMDALAGNTDKLAAVLENRTGNTTFVQITNEENQSYDPNYQQQEGRNNERNSDESRRNKSNKTENSVDFLEQMRLGLV